MSWKHSFKRYDPDSTRAKVATRFKSWFEAFSAFSVGDDLTRNIEAASYALAERFQTGETSSEITVAYEVLPFASLPEVDCVRALGEYAVFKERRASANIPHLTEAVRGGVASLMRNSDARYDKWRFGLYKLLDTEKPFPWTKVLDEDTIGLIAEGAYDSAERLNTSYERSDR